MLGIIKVKGSYVKLKVFAAMIMKNSVFWEIKYDFVPHRNTLRLRYRAQPVYAV
jgi:hypothetical protein